MAEDRVRQSLLLDFYGELLTEKQRECCELHFNEDLSLSEIAEQCGISRQGVWDNIRRAAAALEETEEKIGLIRRFNETQRSLEDALDQAEALRGALCGENRAAAETLCRTLRDALERG